MPIVEVKMLEGRTDEQKRNMARRITDILVEEAGAKRESVVVLINDFPKNCVANGGVLVSDK